MMGDGDNDDGILTAAKNHATNHAVADLEINGGEDEE